MHTTPTAFEQSYKKKDWSIFANMALKKPVKNDYPTPCSMAYTFKKSKTNKFHFPTSGSGGNLNRALATSRFSK